MGWTRGCRYERAADPAREALQGVWRGPGAARAGVCRPVGSAEVLLDALRTPEPECLGESVVRDAVEHPAHYTSHPSGVECLAIVRWFNFNRGNAIKYIWRAGLKGSEIEDLRKAEVYIRDEIQRLEEMKG